MQRGHLQRAWKAWRATIVAVAAVIAIGSLASASPSLRPPRGPHEPLVTGPTGLSGSTGPAGLSGPTGTTGPKNEPVQESDDTPSEGADFSACKGLTGLDNAICRHEALLVVQPDNQGLQNSLAHLQEIKAKHEAKSGDDEWRRLTVGGRFLLEPGPRPWSERGDPRERRWQRPRQRQGPLNPPNPASDRSNLATRERRPRRGPPTGARSRPPGPSARGPRRRR